MVTEVRIYAEGGGDKKDTRALLREGFSRFLDSLRKMARNKGIRWNVTVCGGRYQAHDRFATALNEHHNAFNVLLVDSEGPVANTPWLHLLGRDNWSAHGTNDDHCHLMVQAMEAWLIADPGALSEYYGQGFNANPIPCAGNVETIPKASLVPILETATQQTQKGQYRKIQQGADLLSRVDTEVVRGKAPYCDRMFTTLTKKME
jgi:hypothetical protein